MLGPHYKHRKQIIPKPPELKLVNQDQITQPKQLELKMKIIAAIAAACEDPKVIRKILEHMGLSTKPPPLYPARGPPKHEHHLDDDFTQQHFEMSYNNFDQSSD